MNCTEVMELIQLKLDDMEYDHNLLTEHMRRCPACAEMFERLSRLHQQLVELPKVQPAYSLVDAILPQLDELDRVKAPQAEENTIISAPVPLMQSNSKSQEETLSRPKNVHGSTSPAVRMNKWFKWKAVSGVIAAGLVVGLFVINYQPVSQESADFSELSVNKSEEKVAKSTDPSTEQGSTEVGGKAVANESTQTDPDHNGNGDSPGQGYAQDNTDPEQVSRESNREQPEQPTAEEGASKPLTTSRIAPVKPKDSGSEQPSSKGGGNKGDKPKPNPETVKPAGHQTPDTKPKGDKEQQPPVGGQGVTDGAGESTGRDKKGIVPDGKEASLFTASIDSHSPDKSYTVRWINGQLMLYRYENNSPIIVQILDFTDTPEQINWSEDNKQITVTVGASDGKTKDVVYQVDNKGLHKVTAPAKPSEENAKSPALPPAEPEPEAPTHDTPSPVNGDNPVNEPGEDPTISPAPDTGTESNP
ncbi:hypothetical protein [Paenibacillus agilis]|uniref:Zinc-finger domain-containing protein n=1 Tax=Paenibacillus agilis TaxID=3020863 RepID=A0A559J385_9BACL|nr:hypothetical protein [Paenibacillus agilis]TVX94339.1 hypothetical protein FPZ44_15540 [Paenibacillus agilis]